MEPTFFLIRHKVTGKYMPQMKRGRGYTHWNPGLEFPKDVFSATSFPRLLESEKQARRVISDWASLPNSRNDYEGDLQIGKDDGRKKEDLEIVQAVIKIKGPNDPYWSNFNGK